MRTHLFVAAALATFLVTPGASRTRDLTFRDRVDAQRAIERVHYSHQAGATLPFEEAVPEAILERKVRTTLKQSVALEKFWKTPITAEMLDAEIERMRQTTRMPARLSELFAALDHDRVLIRECLARPVLAERLLENFYAFDPRLHANERGSAEEIRLELAAKRTGHVPAPNLLELRLGEADLAPAAPESADGDTRDKSPRHLTVPEDEFREWRGRLPSEPGYVGAVAEEKDQYTISVVLEEEPDRLLIASYVVPKKSRETWWHEVETGLEESASQESSLKPPDLSGNLLQEGTTVDPVQDSLSPDPHTSCAADNTWTSHLDGDVPPPRRDFTAVWTGSRMIVWGGSNANAPTNTGALYDPATNTWMPTSLINAPTARHSHVAVWTGSRMVIWSGTTDAGVTGITNSGGLYDPLTDQWTAMTTVALSARYLATAVWSGSEMLAWGGVVANGGSTNTGGRYDPVSDTWTGISVTNAPSARISHSAVWAGSKMVIWGGIEGANIVNDGGVYDPVLNSWTPTSTIGAPSRRYDHTAIWTGNQVLVWGGHDGVQPVQTGGRYDPSANQWIPISVAGAPQARTDHSAVWSDTRMLIWGGVLANGASLNTGGRYDPGTDSWQSMTAVGAPAPRSAHQAVWTGSLMLAWGGDNSGTALNTGGRYDPASDSWTPTVTGGTAPSARESHTAIWTGSEMVVWGGISPNEVDSGGRYDPAINEWSPTALAGAPSARQGHTAVWTGNRMVIWGGYRSGFPALTDGAMYDPVSDSWNPTSLTGAPSARYGHTAVWTGSSMIVWGGWTDTGGRFDPVANTWSATSMTGAPAARHLHTAVWSGSQMIIWGGVGTSSVLNTGGRYDPLSDTWLATSTLGAPEARKEHTAVWTGSLMIVFGGRHENPLVWPACSPNLGSAGRYNPGTDTWSVTSDIASPRTQHTAIWTGTKVIVWGGAWTHQSPFGGNNCLSPVTDFLNSGGIYTPTSNQSTSVSTGYAPAGRSSHSAVWTGESMLVWGGRDFSVRFQDGGSLAMGQLTDGDGDGFTICGGDCNDSNLAIHPGAAEVCNQVDDDCDSVIDEGFDQDGDGVTRCLGDCNDADPGAWGFPVEVTDLNLGVGSPTPIDWFELGPYIGTGTTYDLVSGPLTGSAGINLGSAVCLQNDGGNPYSDTRPNPPPGAGYWYLSRARNSCGIGTYGSNSSGAERSIPACP